MFTCLPMWLTHLTLVYDISSEERFAVYARITGDHNLVVCSNNPENFYFATKLCIFQIRSRLSQILA